MLRQLQAYGLWRMIAWGEAGLATLDGATYFARGDAVAAGPSYYLMRRIPFGLHTYGVVMLILAGCIIYSSAQKGKLARKVQFSTFVLGIWISASVIVSWSYAGAASFGAVTKWFFISWVALSLYLNLQERRILDEEE